MSAAVDVLRIAENPEAEFLSLWSNAPHAFVLCRADGAISSFNPATQQLLGRNPYSHPVVRFLDLIPLEQHPLVEREIHALMEGMRTSFQIDTRTSGLNACVVRWTAWRLQGDRNAFLAFAEEVPDAVAVEHRLRQAQHLEAIGRLAGGVAHDFNNLLTGVLLYCDLLMASLDPSHRAHKYADEIRKAGFQATGIVRQLLAVARPTASQARALCLNEIVESMRNLLSRLIGENFELTFHLDPGLGLVSMDPSHAQQILLNLVLNARDAMPLGGKIRIETRNCKVQILADDAPCFKAAPTLPCALFLVSDNGPGMDESVRAHVFEPFFTTKAARGTGLGLSTVHDVVTTSGGLIYVDSEPGQGTRVSVLLPIASQQATESLNTSSYPMNDEELSSHEEKE
ncbi:MAG: ATP-binding protein [Candidatus Sulfotelmatobacter sp.]